MSHFLAILKQEYNHYKDVKNFDKPPTLNGLKQSINHINRLEQDVDNLIKWAQANMPEMDCRGDEDCDHCHLKKLVKDIKTQNNIDDNKRTKQYGLLNKPMIH